ncbi:protein trachealess-like isoform X2 [Amphibalanus amphitrite]|uniref:protein trachealess-like isoform X2 n=1 Tax=Amphibalanus amphitrite TaxID=1232801 RepID=UPI001C91B90C|nr:protein trachealess-like isoform X2 [Amphibalanus amphitrite]
MMQPGDGFPGGHHSLHPHSHVPMDLHMAQGFQYYRYGHGTPQDYHLAAAGLHWSPDMMQPAQSGILEIRKEKSRDAARSRRGKENYEFYELAKMLPLPGAITSQLDKASIIRLTISFLKIGEFSAQGDPPWAREPPPNKLYKSTHLRSRGIPMSVTDVFDSHQGTHILQSLDGFAFTLATDGRFLYISETVSIYLGLSQVEMCGSSIFDYIHSQDHAEFAEHTGLTLSNGRPLASPGEENAGPVGTHNPDVNAVMTVDSNSGYDGLDRAICVRMKSTLTKRGCHFKTPGYRVVLLQCRLRPQYAFSHNRKTSSPNLLGLVAMAIALPPPSVNEVRLDADMFVTRLTFDFQIAHCEPKVSEMLDYSAEELTGRSLYTLCHGADAHLLRKAHVDLLNKGQVLTSYYRLLNKSGGYTWLQTCATIVCNNKNAEEQMIICVNTVISRTEQEGVFMDQSQMTGGVSTRSDDGGGLPSTGPERTDGSSTASESSPGASESTSDLRIDGVVESKGSAKQMSQDHTKVKTETSSSFEGSERAEASGSMNLSVAPAVAPLSAAPVPAAPAPDTARSRKRKLAPEETPEPRPAPSPRGTAEPPPERGAEPRWKPTRCDETSSVKELESAMSKHLPGEPTDFSADALLRNQQRPTIQWIGAGSQAPASTLLRQLYASRESVIRSNIQAAASRAAYYPDMQNMLPTPPGGETYNEQFYKLATDGYALPYGGGGVSAGYDYHSMTPPSSVSPRDKAAHGEQFDPRFESFKPQPYPYLAGLEQSQFGGDPSRLYPDPTGFHLYHSSPKSPGSYDALKSPAAWYAPQS